MSRIKFHAKHVDTLKKYGTMVFTNVPQKHQWVSLLDAANPDPEDSIGAMAMKKLLELGYAKRLNRGIVQWTGKEAPTEESYEKPALGYPDEDVWPEWEEMTREKRFAAAWAAGPNWSKMDFLRVVQFLREELTMEQASHAAAREVIAEMYSRAEEYYNS